MRTTILKTIPVGFGYLQSREFLRQIKQISHFASENNAINDVGEVSG